MIERERGDGEDGEHGEEDGEHREEGHLQSAHV